MAIRIVNGEPELYAFRQLRRDNPNISFPAEPRDKTLAAFDCYRFERVERPAVTGIQQAHRDGFEKEGGVWRERWRIDTAPATEDAVLAERDRRIETGTTIDVPGAGLIPVSGRAQVQADLTSLTTAAQIAMLTGDTTATFPFRDEARVIHSLTGTQVIALYMAGVQWLAAVRAAAWALIDADPIPVDYHDDAHWPQS